MHNLSYPSKRSGPMPFADQGVGSGKSVVERIPCSRNRIGCVLVVGVDVQRPIGRRCAPATTKRRGDDVSVKAKSGNRVVKVEPGTSESIFRLAAFDDPLLRGSFGRKQFSKFLVRRDAQFREKF